MKILIVDDSFANRYLLNEILSSESHEILEAENGKIAIDSLVDFNPDIILLDIEMPVMNGYEVLEKIRNSPSPECSRIIIAVTAHLREDFDIKIRTDSFNAIISKPFTPDKIINTLNSFAEKISS